MSYQISVTNFFFVIALIASLELNLKHRVFVKISLTTNRLAKLCMEMNSYDSTSFQKKLTTIQKDLFVALAIHLFCFAPVALFFFVIVFIEIGIFGADWAKPEALLIDSLFLLFWCLLRGQFFVSLRRFR